MYVLAAFSPIVECEWIGWTHAELEASSVFDAAQSLRLEYLGSFAPQAAEVEVPSLKNGKICIVIPRYQRLVPASANFCPPKSTHHATT